ncbi:MAG: hypothetical protein ISQ13_00480 [Candidatus Margulisbacteria bacterium]|nr:hypothetical protein [Candidatus Margulisiibacteriota bacterium]
MKNYVYKYYDFFGKEEEWLKSTPRAFKPTEKYRTKHLFEYIDSKEGEKGYTLTEIEGGYLENKQKERDGSKFSLNLDLIKEDLMEKALYILQAIDYTSHFIDSQKKSDYEAYKVELRKFVNKTENPTTTPFPTHPYPEEINSQLYLLRKQGIDI